MKLDQILTNAFCIIYVYFCSIFAMIMKSQWYATTQRVANNTSLFHNKGHLFGANYRDWSLKVQLREIHSLTCNK